MEKGVLGRSSSEKGVGDPGDLAGTGLVGLIGGLISFGDRGKDVNYHEDGMAMLLHFDS